MAKRWWSLCLDVVTSWRGEDYAAVVSIFRYGLLEATSLPLLVKLVLSQLSHDVVRTLLVVKVVLKSLALCVTFP